MKKLYINILLIVIALSPISYLHSPTYAATPTTNPKPSQNVVPTNAEDLEKIQKIKDIVASKVAELNLVEKRGIIGIIKEVSGMRIVITDIKGNTRQIEADELTKFSLSNKDAGISDLEKGKKYSFVGLYNRDTQKLLARTISSTSTIPAQFEGSISSIDVKGFQLTIVNEKGESKKIDIESSTKTSLADEEGDLVKSGFSKLEENERILAIGFWDKKDSTLMSATRLIHFKSVPPSKEMQSHVK